MAEARAIKKDSRKDAINLFYRQICLRRGLPFEKADRGEELVLSYPVEESAAQIVFAPSN